MEESDQANTHMMLSVTVSPPSKELAPIELISVGSDTVGTVTVEKVANGRLEVTVKVTRGWLHNVELRIRLPDMDKLNEFQICPVPTKDKFEFIARSRAAVNVEDSNIDFADVKQWVKWHTHAWDLPLRAIRQLYQ